jgi:hypothetical protein
MALGIWNILNCAYITFTNLGTHLSDEPFLYFDTDTQLCLQLTEAVGPVFGPL